MSGGSASAMGLVVGRLALVVLVSCSLGEDADPMPAGLGQDGGATTGGGTTTDATAGPAATTTDTAGDATGSDGTDGCVMQPWYPDADGDGHGAIGPAVMSCSALPGHAPIGDDCDDADPDVHPDADEVCDGQDNDCDDAVDEPAPTNDNCKGCDLVEIDGRGYAICEEDRTWPDARDRCRDDFDGELIEIDDATENDAIVALVDDYPEERWWIGLNDLEQEGTFEWIDGSPDTYTDWADMQPDDYLGEDCAELAATFDYQWNDYGCDVQHGYVCEL